mmetsp:Transcript_1532/g.2747  ORF Transcript_1532/g.2747 Transcript_1532/m.2747 type:complete len:327 (+) Transcript_1532:89-1069(+)
MLASEDGGGTGSTAPHERDLRRIYEAVNSGGGGSVTVPLAEAKVAHQRAVPRMTSGTDSGTGGLPNYAAPYSSTMPRGSLSTQGHAPLPPPPPGSSPGSMASNLPSQERGPLQGFSALDSGRDRDIRPDIFRSGFGGENRGASGFGESGINGLNGLNDVDVTVMAYAQWISEMKQQDVGKTRRKVPKPEISEGAKTHPLNTLISDPDATMPVGVVADFLLTLNWRRFDDDILDRRIEQLYEDARSADLTGDSETLVKSRNLALRLEGVKTRKYEVGLKAVPETGPLRKSRSDVFAQSMLRPSRALDETGRMVIQVSAEGRHTTLCK